MSLCDARNSTTSRFSFLIGTMSKRHQKGVPVNDINNHKINRERVEGKKET
jgi:hypothetical protein